MFRFQVACKGWLFSDFRLEKCNRNRLYSNVVSCLQVSSNGIERIARKIDFELQFESRNKTGRAKCLHARLIVSGKAQNVVVSTQLVNHYAHMGEIYMSRRIFDFISSKNVFAWNSMMSSYVRNGCYRDAVKCLSKMLMTADVRPDFYTFPTVLKACGNLIDGSQIHTWAFKMGFQLDVFVASALVHMYCKFGSFRVAREIFNVMTYRDQGCWNAIISGLCQNGYGVEALEILDKMRMEGIAMDPVTVSTILSVCAQIDDFCRGCLIHLYAIKHGLEFDLFVGNALINMYAKFGLLGNAQKVFDLMEERDLVSWNSLIAAYEQNYNPDTALDLCREMQLHDVQPDFLTLVSLASSVAQTQDSQNSGSLHAFILKRCWIQEHVAVGNAVVDMYAKLGIMDSALKVFEELPSKDLISWNTMITGYAQNGFASEAIEVYSMLENCENIIPNEATWVSVLPAYAHVGSLRGGTKIHAHTLKAGFNLDVFVGTSLVDLYGKCGRLNDAMSLFYEVPRRNPIPWNAVISCHAIHGHGETCLQLFGDMLDEGVNPDHVSFVSLLSACSHSGLVSQGQWCFDLMHKCGVKPSLKHYGCMVDLLGRAGHLDKAYNFIKSMPLQPDASIWGALLGACRIHGNVELGNLASNRLFEVDSENVGYYVLLSNIYANVGKWEGVDQVRSLARDRGLRKTPGWSSMEIDNKVEVFYTGNQSHPQCEDIYNELEILTDKIKSLGYVPDYSFVLQDVEEDEKQHILTSHSERLAIAYGIISTPPKTTIRIFKNLRVCGDCHNATKLISKITEREIIVRDSNRFHHFKDGNCSCGDYW
ncbi:hypothetical protein AgCh_001344 [Apium graveolens]